MAGVVTAKAELKSVVSSKNAAKSDVVANVRALVREFKANPLVPQSVLNALGVIGQPNSGPVTTVSGLTVMGCDDGVNKLKWNRNGNTPSTLFIIETKLPTQSSWTIAGAVTRTSFDHENQAPGETRLYRIVSNRAGMASAPTTPVVVYGDTGDTALSIAA